MEYKFGTFIKTGFVHSVPGERNRIDIDLSQIEQVMELTGLSFNDVFTEFISHEHIHHILYMIGGATLCHQLDDLCSNWIYRNVNIDMAERTQPCWDGGLPNHKAIKNINWMK